MKTPVFQLRRVVFLAVLAICVSSGCRFGNRIENAPQTDPISAFYETEPTDISYCATVSGSTQCQSGLNLAVPDEIGQAMSNPVLLYVYDLTIGLYQFIPTTGLNYAWPVYAQTDGTLQGYEAPHPVPYLNSPTCKITKSFEQSGRWEKSNGPWTSGKQNQFPPSGRILINYQRIISFEQDCGAAMQQSLNCYNDFNACGESTLIKNQEKQIEIRGMFNPYIQAGVMTIPNISNISAIGYEVSYR
jgi:hypothetical protein